MRCFFSFMILLIAVNASAQKLNTGMAAAFNKFQKELGNYRLQLKSDSILYATQIGVVAMCDQYVLQWKETENNGVNGAVQAQKENFCADWRYFERQNKKMSGMSGKNESVYGMWDYHGEYVGARYIIVTGNAAVNSIRREVYYYVRKG